MDDDNIRFIKGKPLNELLPEIPIKETNETVERLEEENISYASVVEKLNNTLQELQAKDVF